MADLFLVITNLNYLLEGELMGESPDLQVECAAGLPMEDLNSEDPAVVVSSPFTQSGTLFICKVNHNIMITMAFTVVFSPINWPRFFLIMQICLNLNPLPDNIF